MLTSIQTGLTRVVINTGCALFREIILRGISQDFASKQVWSYVFDTTGSTLAADIVIQLALNRYVRN
jgi:hypothetical protein